MSQLFSSLALMGALLAAALAGAPYPVEAPPASPVAARADSSALFAARYGVDPPLASLIYRESTRQGVTPAMVFALIETESGFDPRAVGPSGARGLMQILPSTARAYDRKVTIDRLHDPAHNLRLGLLHLKRELDHFGEVSLALAAYNRGRAGVRRALARGFDPAAGYAERILARCEQGCVS